MIDWRRQLRIRDIRHDKPIHKSVACHVRQKRSPGVFYDLLFYILLDDIRIWSSVIHSCLRAGMNFSVNYSEELSAIPRNLPQLLVSTLVQLVVNKCGNNCKLGNGNETNKCRILAGRSARLIAGNSLCRKTR